MAPPPWNCPMQQSATTTMLCDKKSAMSLKLESDIVFTIYKQGKGSKGTTTTPHHQLAMPVFAGCGGCWWPILSDNKSCNSPSLLYLWPLFLHGKTRTDSVGMPLYCHDHWRKPCWGCLVVVDLMKINNKEFSIASTSDYFIDSLLIIKGSIFFDEDYIKI